MQHIFAKYKPTTLLQFSERLRAVVSGGLLAAGTRLPTIHCMAKETGLSYYTVNRAIGMLCTEGLLVSRKRAGTFVVGKEARSERQKEPIRLFAMIAPELSTGFYPLLQKGFDLAAGALGYQIISSNTNNDVRVQADTILQLMDKSVAGVAIVPGTEGPLPAHHIRQLHRRGIPVVMLHRAIEGVSAPRIVIPAEQVGEMAAREILARGHTRVAFCASQRSGASSGYERGFRRGLAEAGVELRDEHVNYGDIVLFTGEHYSAYEEHLERWFDAQMTSGDRPTAIFTSFESIGEITYLLALQCGLRVPQDLSIVTVGGLQRQGAVVRRLACVTLDEQGAGTLTADLLDQMQQGQRPIQDEQTFLIEIGFDTAQTLGSAPSKGGRQGRRKCGP